MLNLTKTFPELMQGLPVAEGSAFTDEGLAAIITSENGRSKIKPSSATTGERVYGFPIFQYRYMKDLPKIERITLGAVAVEHTLHSTAVVDSLQVFQVADDGSLTNITQAVATGKTGTAATAGNFTAPTTSNGRKLTLTAPGADGSGATGVTDTVAGTIEIRYQYIPTEEEKAEIVGHEHTPHALNQTGADLVQLTCIRRGIVSVSTWDTDATADYAPNSQLKAIAGGYLSASTGSSDDAIPNCYVTERPTVKDPWLTFEIGLN